MLRPFEFTKRIIGNYVHDECEIFLVSGMPEGIGKSGYVNYTLADIYGYINCKDRELQQWLWEKVKPRERPEGSEIWELDWEAIKPYILYLPRDVVDLCRSMLEREIRVPMLHWDDGGTWLNAMEFHDPFVVSFMEYSSLARSNWGGIVISTPVEDWVLKKLHAAEGVIRVRITKSGGFSPRYVWKRRDASAFRKIRYLNRNKPYWRREWFDQFNGIMPDSFFKFYAPRRHHYAKVAAQRMEKAILKREARGESKTIARDKAILEEQEERTAEEIAKANDESEDLVELIRSLEPSKA